MNGSRIRLITLGLLATLLVGAETGKLGAAVIAGPFLMTLLAAELDRDGRLIAVHLARLAAWIALPRGPGRDDLREEWLGFVEQAGDDGLGPVLVALTFLLIAAPRLVIIIRLPNLMRRYLAGCALAGEEIVDVDSFLRSHNALTTMAVMWFVPGAFWAVPLLGLIRMRTGRLSPVVAAPLGVPLMVYWYRSILSSVMHSGGFSLIGFGGMCACIACSLITAALSSMLRARLGISAAPSASSRSRGPSRME